MKTNSIFANIIFIALIVFSGIAFGQRNDENRQKNYENDNRSKRDNRYENQERVGDQYESNSRNNSSDNGYENSGRNERYNNDYRRNPYDYRNLPNNWERDCSRDYDWWTYQNNNRYDPRNRNGFDFYDPYYSYDPNNPYDIRNRRDAYSYNNGYWSGRRPNIVIVPPSVRFGRPGFAWGNRNKGGRHRRW